MKVKQKTISKEIAFSGVGLHSGINCNVLLKPAKENTGILFSKYVDGNYCTVPGDFKYITQSNLCTTIENQSEKIKVFTIEHLLAAVKGNEIDNIEILVDNEEIPALDGSSLEFDKIIKKAKVVEQDEYKKYLSIKKHVSVKINKSSIDLYPSDRFSINCLIDFPSPIGIEEIKLGNNPNEVYEEVLKARTFCFYSDIEKMRKAGLARGGSLENAIVIKNDNIMNEKGLRMRGEFVKHKILDMLGDFSLINYNLKAKIDAICPGHEINNAVMKAIFSDFENYDILQHKNEIGIFNPENLIQACN